MHLEIIKNVVIFTILGKKIMKLSFRFSWTHSNGKLLM